MLTKWKICIKEPFQNCEYIYPIQQKKISHLLSFFKQDTNIKSVYVFGSSISERCHIGSDIDLYLDLEEDKKVYYEANDFAVDLWTNYTVDKRLYEEIMKGCVLVYERRKDFKKENIFR